MNEPQVYGVKQTYPQLDNALLFRQSRSKEI